MFFDLWG